MTELFDRERLDHLVGEGWLRCQRHPDADLWIYNYTEATQYANHWTPETLACRGLILDGAGEVVARPFPKFFNYGTQQAADLPLHEPYVVTEKMDGSLGILYRLDGEAFIATRGSFTSEQARVGTAILHEQGMVGQVGTTPLFEIIYPSNRIVVDYGDRRELVLLGCIDNATGRDAPLPDYLGPVVDRLAGASLEALAAADRPNAEGYVVAFESGARVKIKHDEYVRLHRIVTGVNARNIWEALAKGDDLAALLDGIPDEIHDWIKKTENEIHGAFAAVEFQALQVFADRPETDDRKTLAGYFTASDANAAVLFRMLDDRPYADLIWKAVKPEALTPDSVREAVDLAKDVPGPSPLENLGGSS